MRIQQIYFIQKGSNPLWAEEPIRSALVGLAHPVGDGTEEQTANKLIDSNQKRGDYFEEFENEGQFDPLDLLADIKESLQPKKAKNVVKQRYIALSTNFVICIDITDVGVYGQLLVGMDLAGRVVVGHCYSSEPITTKLVCETITQIIEKRAFLPKIGVIHTDRGSIFSNEEYFDFMNQHQILRSRGAAEGRQNQVVERFFRSFKLILRRLICPGWTKEQPDPLTRVGLSSQEMAAKIKEAIEIYNQRPHRSLGGLSPNQMEEALYLKHGNKHPNKANQLMIVRNDNSKLATETKHYLHLVATVYQNDWLAFFLKWKHEQADQHREVIARLAENADQAKKRAQDMQEQYQNIYHAHQEILREVIILRERAEAIEREKNEKEAKKLKKKQAKKQELRQTVSPQEFEHIITLVKGRGNAAPRRRLALVLLFLTGLRVSNLLLFKVQHAADLMEKANTNIPLIKGGESRYPLRLSAKGRKMLLRFKDDSACLKQGKTADMHLFTANKEPQKPIARETFDKELNFILVQASAQFEKHLRTHSFRATFITQLLKYSPIDEVKELIGHKSVTTTMDYKRSRLTTRQMDKMLAKLDYPAFKSQVKQIRTYRKGKKPQNKLKPSQPQDIQ